MSLSFLRWAPALLLVCGLHAGVLVQSTFDTGKDGWKNLDLLNTSTQGDVSYSATGGNPGVRYVYIQHAGPGASWTTFSVPLGEASGWHQVDLAWKMTHAPGSAATNAQLQTAPANVKYLRLFADFGTGIGSADVTGLDNVILYTHSPEPSTGSATAACLVAAAVWLAARRYRTFLGGDCRKTANAPDRAAALSARGRR